MRLLDLSIRQLVTLRWRKPAQSPELAPVPSPAEAFAALSRALTMEQGHLQAEVQVASGPAPAASSLEEIRRAKSAEAWNSPQPFEWSSHVYVTVRGEVRWRCCMNLFTDAHGPWCASPGSTARTS